MSEIGVYVSLALTVEAFLDVWALGDCAVIPTNRADYYPPTAQRASREGKVMAYNIVASVRSEALKPFQLKALDQLPPSVVARILGINFSGFIAWWL